MKYKNFLTLLITWFCIVSGFSQVPSYVPTNGLMGWWPFNGNANDETTNKNNASFNNANLALDRYNNSQSSYSFNGSNHKITINHISNYDITKSFTVSLWVKLATYNKLGVLCEKFTTTSGAGDGGFQLVQKADGMIQFNVIHNNINNIINASNLLDTISWHHILCSWNGSEINMFIDNSFIGKASFNSILNSSTSNISMGYRASLSDLFYPGKIDDFGFWNRALTNQEIKTLFEACRNDEISGDPSNSTELTGKVANFSLTAKTGSAYQWQSNPIGFGWQNVPNTNQYSGATTQSLSISNLALNNHKQQFRAIVTNGPCKDTSKVVEIIITDTCINTKSVSVADTLKFAVNLTGVSPPNNRNAMKVYPNPTNSAVVIDNGNYTAMSNYIVKIENSIGQQVYFSKVNQQQFVVDVSTLGGKGVYTLSVLDSVGKLLETKMIVLQ